MSNIYQVFNLIILHDNAWFSIKSMNSHNVSWVCLNSAVNSKGKEIFLRDIWPTREEIHAVERQFVIPAMFKEVYEKVEVLYIYLYTCLS